MTEEEIEKAVRKVFKNQNLEIIYFLNEKKPYCIVSFKDDVKINILKIDELSKKLNTDKINFSYNKGSDRFSEFTHGLPSNLELHIFF